MRTTLLVIAGILCVFSSAELWAAKPKKQPKIEKIKAGKTCGLVYLRLTQHFVDKKGRKLRAFLTSDEIGQLERLRANLRRHYNTPHNQRSRIRAAELIDSDLVPLFVRIEDFIKKAGRPVSTEQFMRYIGMDLRGRSWRRAESLRRFFFLGRSETDVQYMREIAGRDLHMRASRHTPAWRRLTYYIAITISLSIIANDDYERYQEALEGRDEEAYATWVWEQSETLAQYILEEQPQLATELVEFEATVEDLIDEYRP